MIIDDDALRPVVLCRALPNFRLAAWDLDGQGNRLRYLGRILLNLLKGTERVCRADDEINSGDTTQIGDYAIHLKNLEDLELR